MKEQFTTNQQLIAARLKKGWTQKRAADACRVGERTYRNWEARRNDPSLDSLLLLMEAFGLSAQELGYAHLVEIASDSISPVQEMQEVASEAKPFMFASLSVSVREGADDPVPPGSSVLTGLFDQVTQFTVTIFGLVNGWRGRAALCSELQHLLSLEFAMFDASNENEGEQQRLSRRQALIALAALPQSLVLASRATGAAIAQEEFLPQCTAAITSCWSLMQGREFGVVENSLAHCLPGLSALAQQSSPYQQAAASLASQGQFLLSLVSLHRLSMPANVQNCLLHCQQAVEFGRISADRSFLIVALIHLGGTYSDLDRIPEMLAANEEAAHLSSHETVLPVLRRKALAELARAYARAGQIQQALRLSGEAQTMVSDLRGPAPVYLTDSGPFWEGVLEAQMYQELGKQAGDKGFYERAWAAMERPDFTSTSLLVPERLRLEGVNQKALVALRLGHLEQFHTLSIQGVQGAKMLQSGKRQQEVIANWREARKVWPQEPQVMELADLLLE
jgi:transcriptional regulator with XRE-family HTH domain/tetratricopeptide (TPR) repeat protein